MLKVVFPENPLDNSSGPDGTSIKGSYIKYDFDGKEREALVLVPNQTITPLSIKHEQERGTCIIWGGSPKDWLLVGDKLVHTFDENYGRVGPGKSPKEIKLSLIDPDERNELHFKPKSVTLKYKDYDGEIKEKRIDLSDLNLSEIDLGNPEILEKN